VSNRLLSAHRATVDFETGSEADLKNVGAVKYSEHPSTHIQTMSYKLPGGKRGRWKPGLPFPQELIDFVEKGGTIEAHNALFEQSIWLNQLHKKLGIPMPKRWYDTQARCAQRALPLGLDEVGRVLDLDVQKDKHGKYLLQKLSKPRKPLKADILAWAEQHGVHPLPKKPKPTQEQKDAHYQAVLNLPPIPTLWADANGPTPSEWGDDRTLFQALQDYCDQDVEAEDLLGQTIGDMDDAEYVIWVLDQKINWRGVRVDIEAVQSALSIIHDVETRLTAELMTLTGGEVTTGNQVAKIKEWAAKNGVILESLSKDIVEQAIDQGDEDFDEEPEEDEDEIAGIGDNGGPPLDDSENNEAWPKVKRVLRIRQQLSRGSTKKLKRMIDCMCEDGRVRGMMQYHGAGTGRWAGRLVQPHNFPRGNPKIVKKGIEPLIAAIKCRSADLLTMFYGDPMDAIASALRGMFIAAKGKTYRVADFSAIEARVTMWLAGEEDALEAFLKSDRKEGPDIYCVMAQKLYNRPIDKEKDPNERQLGKITILGCFEADTEVLTDRGWIRIVDVTTADKVWDGEEWVNHDGPHYQGKKPTTRLAGIGVTPDHMMMTPDDWVPASAVVNASARYQQSVHDWAISRLPASEQARAVGSPLSTPCAFAVQKRRSTSQTFEALAPRDAMRALRKRLRSGYERTKATATSCLTTLSAICGLLATPVCSPDASTPITLASSTTAREESKSASTGSIGATSLSTFKWLPAGTTLLSKLIASTTTAITKSATSAWRRDRSKCSTDAPVNVYDLIECGPRHRFFVRSPGGGLPLCASNCGYQMGWQRLQEQAKKDYKVILTDEQAQFLVNGYRESFPKVKLLWYGLEEAAVSAVMYPGRAFDFNGITYQVETDAAGTWLSCKLPNGRKLWYREPRLDTVQMFGRDGKPWNKKQIGYWGRDSKLGGRWNFIRTYGGMLTENVVQAISRDILAEAMGRVEVAQYPIVLTVHDEVISEAEASHGTQREFEDLMMVTPAWLPGCPINVEGWCGQRYRKA
jgi:DNA polymerase